MKRLVIIILLAFLISWSCEDEKSDKSVVSSIVITPNKIILKPGKTEQFYALVIDQNNMAMDADITWKSSIPSVATINNEGLVTAVTTGSTEIFATVDAVQGLAETLVSGIRRRVLSELITSST
tara:strand:- start:214 stop:585 length:372 start_codon:yes stop_codon:yes gene_type:complete